MAPKIKPRNKPILLGAKNYEGDTGVRTPADFMADWRETEARNTPKAPTVIRQVTFKDVPEWANLSDVLCLVFGGPIERIWSEQPNEVTVRFLWDGDCKDYYKIVQGGISIGRDMIEIEMASCEALPDDVKAWTRKGASRVVQVDVPNDKTFQDLHNFVKDLDLDHLTYHVEPNKARNFDFGTQEETSD